ncbi:MAG: hypothetical protein ACRC6V_03240 [Bacteroidales bacterium]
MTFTETKEGLAWWSQLDKVIPVLEVYTDSYMDCGREVEAIREQLKNPARDDESVVALGKLFHWLWFNAPDEPKIHSYPQWSTICALASGYSAVYKYIQK